MKPCRPSAAAIALALALAPALASAEPHRWPAPEGEPPKATIDEALARYRAGNAAWKAGRAADALAEFERSYALSGVPAALFNVASTLRDLGRHVEARDAFAQYLEAHRDADAEQRAEAKRRLDEEKARVATLVLDDLPPKGDVSVWVDGARVADDGKRPLVVDLDPQRHDLRVEQARKKPMHWRGVLVDGERRALAVRLEADPLAETPPPPPPPAPAKGGVLRSPIFWTIVGAAVVGGAATGLYFGLKGSGGTHLDPGSSNVVHL
jgi:tetratricopeptide (TPR) repeat protein